MAFVSGKTVGGRVGLGCPVKHIRRIKPLMPLPVPHHCVHGMQQQQQRTQLSLTLTETRDNVAGRGLARSEACC